jgi:hypothetical protein
MPGLSSTQPDAMSSKTATMSWPFECDQSSVARRWSLSDCFSGVPYDGVDTRQ